MAKVKHLGIIYNGNIPSAKPLTETIKARVSSLHATVWLSTAQEALQQALPHIEGTDLVITIGGDGTILRAAQVTAPFSVPILGINVGQVGFMTELSADEAPDKVHLYLDDVVSLEERTMLQAEVVAKDHPSDPSQVTHHALNDVVLARGSIARLIPIDTSVDGRHLTTYRADALIVATATGSTSYNLAAGGPILHPTSSHIVLKPVAAHLSFNTALVLAGTSRIEMSVSAPYEAVVSIDGQINFPLHANNLLRVTRSPHLVRFLRANPSTHFYNALHRCLGVNVTPISK